MSAKTITVFSNKGGVGKTFVAVNLATALAATKHKVLLIDLDFQAGQDIHRMLRLSPRQGMVDLYAQIEQQNKKVSFQDGIAQHSSGFDFLPIVTSPRQVADIHQEKTRQVLKCATEAYDFILIDGGKAFNESLVTVLDNSNLILLVATPDILAVSQIRWCLDILQSLQFPLKMVQLILNRSESRGSVAWQEVRSALTCQIFSHIPSDGKAVGAALNQGVPCVLDNPKSKVTEAFVRMVSLLRKEDIFLKAIESVEGRSIPGVGNASQFLQKFGDSHKVIKHAPDDIYAQQDKEEVSLKKKLHEKLIERLKLDGVTTESLNDPQIIIEVKKTSETIVSNLLVEESGGLISNYEERTRLVRDIVNEVLGLGPLEEFLEDADVTDIMANNKDEIYIEKKGKLIFTRKKFVSNERMRSIIDRIIAPLGRRIDESTPMVDARLPDGSRVNAIIPPLSLEGPMITIRKFGAERLGAEDLVRNNSMTREIADFLRAAVVARKNLIISGGTGAGKTTLLNVVSEFIPEGERIITIEDAAELRLKKAHVGRLESRPMNVEGKGEVTVRDLFVNCLRMRPDRIVIGECRGAEVLDMLQAMNTGHEGSLTTLHANSTRDVLTRMHSMILLSGLELPVRAIHEMVGTAIDIIVHIHRFADGARKITGVSEIAGLTEDFQLNLRDVFEFKQTGVSEDGATLGSFQATGYVPKCYNDFATRGVTLDKNIFLKKES